MVYILDLTQTDAINQQLAEGDCKTCGISKDKNVLVYLIIYLVMI